MHSMSTLSPYPCGSLTSEKCLGNDCLDYEGCWLLNSSMKSFELNTPSPCRLVQLMTQWTEFSFSDAILCVSSGTQFYSLYTCGSSFNKKLVLLAVWSINTWIDWRGITGAHWSVLKYLESCLKLNLCAVSVRIHSHVFINNTRTVLWIHCPETIITKNVNNKPERRTWVTIVKDARL